MKSKSIQENILQQLLAKAAPTRIGQKYGFDKVQNYTMFTERVPFHVYDDIILHIVEMKKGTADILWPGKVKKYAVSAGTTGKGKHLPLSEARLASDKRFMKSIAFSYFKQQPNLFRLAGKHLSLPGTVEQHESYQIGEVSGFSALGSPLWLQPFQLVKPATLTQLGFKDKFNLLLQKALDTDIRVITAAPGWILTLFQQVIKQTSANNITEIWPDLNLLICGGMKLDNYRPHLEKLIGRHTPDFIETYGASEGYFAFTDNITRQDLKLVTDNGIFFEFIKDPQPGNEKFAGQKPLPLWEVETGIPYAMVISTNGGLWRYILRDIIEFTSTHPPRIVVKGRISEMLDDFGEALYIYEAEEVLHESLRELNLQKSAFTIIPKLTTESEIPHHHWLIQFSEEVNSDDLHKLTKKIDAKLKKINRHYATRRDGGSLAAPKVGSITQQQVNRWMDARNSSGAQGKLPKILRENTDLLL